MSLVASGKAASELGVHVVTLKRWVAAGRVTPTERTAGGHYRWDMDDLRSQLRGQPPAEPEPDKPLQPAVVAAVVTSRLGVLAARRNDGQPLWTFPAGESEPGESPADTIVREVKEETGLLIRPGAVIGQRVHPATGRVMVYLAARPGSHNRNVIVGDPDELAEVRWLTLADADALMPTMFGPVRDYLSRLLTSGPTRGNKRRQPAVGQAELPRTG